MVRIGWYKVAARCLQNQQPGTQELRLNPQYAQLES
jgi:hypothetical protein